MNKSMALLKNVFFLSVMVFVLCAFPKSVLASVVDYYSDGKVYDVTAYGADKTGASSSSAAVTSAVAAARKDLENGNLDGKSRAVIYFPSGTYKLSESFKIFSNMVLAAENDTVIQASENAVDITHRENIVVEGGIWQSSGSSYVIKDTDSDLLIKNLTITKGSTGIQFFSASVTAENITISGCTDVGIQCTNGTLSMQNIKVSGANTGIALYSSKSTVSDVTLTKCTEVGLQSTKGTLTLKNTAVSGAKTGIGIYSTTVSMDEITVTGCTGLGINISKKAKVTASDMTVSGNGNGYPKKGYLGHGIGVYGSSKLMVSDSTISKNRECGVSLSGGNAVIKNCVLEENGRHAVGTDKVCSLTMTGCTVNKNGLKDNHDGILVVEGSKATITDCTITSNACSGLLVTGASTATVKNCTFKGNKAQNIYIENLGSGKAKVTVNGGKFYKTKSSYSIRVHVNKTSQYSLKLTGSIKYYNKLKKGYTLWMGDEMVYKKK